MSRGSRHVQARVLRAVVCNARRQAAVQAVAERESAQLELQDALTSIGLAVYSLPDGARTPQALDLLANLGWCIGLGASVAHSIEPGSIIARRLHGALRTMHSLCLMGYAWRSVYAPALDAAAHEASELSMAHVDVARVHAEAAGYLCGRIQRREVSASDVAGAELYEQITARVTTC